MMKIKSVSGITCYVKNLNETAAFDETLGFEIRKRDANHVTAYSNWLSIDNVDEFHQYLVSNKIKTLTKPQDQPWGNREFMLRDPDGHNLVIFKRK